MLELVVGLVGGLLIGWCMGRRATPAAPFSANDEEQSEALKAAQAAVGERIQKRLNRIMEKAHSDGCITNDGVEDLFCISDRTASTYLRRLTKAGKLKKQGVGRGTYYTPKV